MDNWETALKKIKTSPVRVQKKTEEETFVNNTTKWKAVAVGANHTVGIDSDGNLWSWGANGRWTIGLRKSWNRC